MGIKQVLWKLLGGRELWVAPPPRVEKATQSLRTMQDVDALIERAGFGAARETIRARALPCFNVLANGKASDTPGATRFGGMPDLPAGTPWPLAKGGGRLAFLAQIDLAGLAQVNPSVLPGTGLMSVFAGSLDSEDSANSAVVFVTPAGTPLSRLTLPEPAGVEEYPSPEDLRPMGVRFEAAFTLPAEERFFCDAVRHAAPEGDEDELNGSWRHSDALLRGQVLGHANSALDDLHGIMAMEALGRPAQSNLLIWPTWEAWEGAKAMRNKLANGTTYSPWSAKDDENVRWIHANRARIEAEIQDWQVLLRIDSNREMGLSINDSDPIYVMIRRSDLAAGDFSRVRALATQG